MNSFWVTISDEAYFRDALDRIKSDGFNKLHVLADFDRTLTKAYYDGKMRPSLISALRSEGYLSEEYVKEAYSLHGHYYPIEIDPNIPMEVKKKEMSDWWHRHLELLLKSWLHKSDIEKIIDSWFIEFRPWLFKLLKFLNTHKIPLVIISANWLGTDAIRMFFEKNWIMSDNIDIISNSFNWDSNWNAVWYDSRVIHTFNKDETVLHDYPEIFESIKNRTNVILLWDSTWDPEMITWFKYDNLIKIWFLNDWAEGLMDTYKKIYDVVLTGYDGADENDAHEIVEIILGIWK